MTFPPSRCACVALVFTFLALLTLRAETVALVGGTAINPADGKVTQDAVILINGEKIESLGARAEVQIPADARRVDCTGKFIIPGLWDMHVHLAGGLADPKWSRDALLPLLLASGVTGIRDMGGNLSALVDWRREIEAGKLVGPRIVACGPFLADAKPGTPDTIPISKPAQGRRAVQTIKRQFGDCIKVLTKLSRESYLAIIEEAKFQDIPVVGHVPDSITAGEASDAGQKSIEHIFYSNLAFDCSAQESELREQRAAAAANKDNAALAKIRTAAEASFDPRKADNLWQTFLRNKTWVCPTLVAIRTVARQRELAAHTDDPRLAYIPPALRAKWTPEAVAKDLSEDDAKWWAAQADYDKKIVRALHTAGVPILAGSDSLDPLNYPGSSLHEELRLLIQAGLTPLEALQTATSNPARFLNRNLGALAPEQLADIVILDADPLADIANTERIHAVIQNGRVFDRAELDRLLAQARASLSR